MPELNEAAMTIRGAGGWPSFKAQLVLALASTAQSTQAANWAATLAACEAVRTALRASSSLAKSKPVWVIRPVTVKVAEVAYWSVVAEVSANG
jgi:hypothetical protein